MREFQVLIARGINRVDPGFQKDPVFRKLRTTLLRYLTEDDEEQAQAA